MRKLTFMALLFATVLYAAPDTLYLNIGVNPTNDTTKGRGGWANAWGSIDTVRVWTTAYLNPRSVLFIKWPGAGGTPDTMHAAWSLSARDGKADSLISIIGLKPGTTHEGSAIVPSDYAIDSSDKPHIYTEYSFTPGDNTTLKNTCWLIKVGFFTSGGTCNVIDNIFISKYTSSTNAYALTFGGGASIVGNLLHISNMNGMNITGRPVIEYNTLIGNRAANNVGIALGATLIHTRGNKLIKLNYGINNTSGSGASDHDRFDSCIVGINGASNVSGYIVTNGTFTDNTSYAISWGNVIENNIFMNNHYHGNAADFNNIPTNPLIADADTVNGDPLLDANGRPTAGSPLIGNAKEAP